ncbi:MFS transporter [Alicyclobacillus dauci]|uniref:MFS transporter n=1 Tax=Alicyclobacillus dauci TaxID=1475485 RepID=A0ABY6Z546_9BACL|nr:MFS transporter [Alicyclobacillus dauci]WAH37981.1 MFS transporter [Alicyclobacillus dauci]
MSANAEIQTRGSKPILGSSFRWSHVVTTLIILQAIGMVDKINVGMVLAYKPFQADMGIVGKHGLAGLLTTLFLLAYGIGMPIWGALSDRVGPRKTGIYACIAWIVFLVLGGLASNLTVLYISRIGLGFAEAAIWPICNNLTARWFPVKERGRSSATWISGINIGIAIAGFLVPPLLVSLGWRSVFFVLAALGLLPIILLSTLVRDNPRDTRASASEIEFIEAGVLEKTDEVPESNMFAHTPYYKNYRFWLATLANTATGMGVFGINTWLPSYLTGVRHMSMTGMGNFTAIDWILCIGILLWLSRWSDRIVRRAAFGMVCFVVYAVLIFFSMEVKSEGSMMVMIGLAIFALQSSTVMNFALVHSFTREASMGGGAGTMAGVSNFLGAFAPYIMGLLIGPNNNYLASFGFLAGMAIVSAIAMAILIPQKY